MTAEEERSRVEKATTLLVEVEVLTMLVEVEVMAMLLEVTMLAKVMLVVVEYSLQEVEVMESIQLQEEYGERGMVVGELCKGGEEWQ